MNVGDEVEVIGPGTNCPPCDVRRGTITHVTYHITVAHEPVYCPYNQHQQAGLSSSCWFDEKSLRPWPTHI